MIRSQMVKKDTARWRAKHKAFANSVMREGELATKNLAEKYRDDAKGWMGKVSPSGGSGPFGAIWEALSKRWIESKRKRSKAGEIWKETGGIASDTRIEKVKNGYFSGIAKKWASISHDGSNSYDRALKNEYGLWRAMVSPLRNIGRPLFRPLGTYYRLRIAPAKFRLALRRAIKVWR